MVDGELREDWRAGVGGGLVGEVGVKRSTMFATGKAEEKNTAEGRFENQSALFRVSGAREGRGYNS